jgi:predicted dehydrogenase
MARFFHGDITRVSAHLATYNGKVSPDGLPFTAANETAMMMVEYASGAQGMIHVSQLAHTADRLREQYMSIHGDLGALECDWKVFGSEASLTLSGARHDEERFQTISVPEEYLNGVELGTIFPVFEKHLVGPRLFIDAIYNDYMPTPNFYDGFKVQQVMDAAIKSHDSGCWIDVAIGEGMLA